MRVPRWLAPSSTPAAGPLSVSELTDVTFSCTTVDQTFFFEMHLQCRLFFPRVTTLVLLALDTRLYV